MSVPAAAGSRSRPQLTIELVRGPLAAGVRCQPSCSHRCNVPLMRSRYVSSRTTSS
jgi:hypothetical protein